VLDCCGVEHDYGGIRCEVASRMTLLCAIVHWIIKRLLICKFRDLSPNGASWGII